MITRREVQASLVAGSQARQNDFRRNSQCHPRGAGLEQGLSACRWFRGTTLMLELVYREVSGSEWGSLWLWRQPPETPCRL